MVKKIILGLLAGFIVFQLLAVSAWNFWLESRHKLVDFELASPISLGGVWVDHENRIWVGYRDTFDVYAGETLQYTFTQTDLLTSPGGLAIDSARGQVWNIATSPEPGVSVFDGATWNLVTTEMPGSYTRARVVDGQGHLWVGSSEGLFVLENGEWRELSAPEPDLPENWVTVLLPGQDDQTWVGTTRGLFLTDGQNWTTFDDSPLDGKMVYAMDVDKNGLLWLGAQDGLYSFNGSAWTIYNAQNSGLRGDTVENLVVDANNRIWGLGNGSRRAFVFDGRQWRYTLEGNSWSYLVADSQGRVCLGGLSTINVFDSNAPLVSRLTYEAKDLVDTGLFIYITIFLAGVWLMIALNAWGIGIGLFFGALAYIVGIFAPLIASDELIFNLGLYVTLGGILGGVVGYFFKRAGKKWADLWGGAIGCGGAFLVAGCCLLTLGVLSAMS